MNSAALSLAASMFETNNTDGESLADTECQLYVLGIKYKTPHDTYTILDDVASRYWFTYRTGFAPIAGPSGPTKDTGWGCMMRCGQMMLAEAYLRFFIPNGRHFRWRPNLSERSYWDVLNMFIDRRHSSYSIHQIVQMGHSEGKEIGQWFGPNTIAQVLRRIASHEFERKISVHVAMDNTLVLNEIRELCRKNAASNIWRPLVIIIPLRLGLTDVNTDYIDQLKLCFRIPQTLGFVGGKPNHAYYFIGYLENDELLYLDPHITQAYVDTTVNNDDTSYHCDRVNRMKFSALDPSLALAFACKTENEFEDLIVQLRKNLPAKPMFEICESSPFDLTGRPVEHHGVMTIDSDEDFEVV